MSAPLEAMRRFASEPFPLPLIAPLAFLSALPGREAMREAALALGGGFAPGIPVEAGTWVFLPLNPGLRWDEARASFGSSVTEGFLPAFPGLLLGKGLASKPVHPLNSLLGAWTLDIIAFRFGDSGPLAGCSWEILHSSVIKKPEPGSRGTAEASERGS
jgi:hypothetical protein